MQAELKPIPGCDNYLAGSDGSIWTTRRKGGNDRGAGRIGKPRKMKTSRDGKGYVKVSLDTGGKVITRSVHDLVLSAFVCPRPEGLEACHYPDSNPSNNRIENLRWDTHAENVRDRFRDTKTRAEKPCTTCRESKPLSDFYKDSRASDGLKSQCKTCHTRTTLLTRDEDRKRKANREYMRRVRHSAPPIRTA